MALGAQLRTWSQVVCFLEVADHSKWTTVWDHFKKPDMESQPLMACDMCQWPKGSCYHGGAHPELASTGMFWWGGWGYEIVTATLAQGLPLFQDLARYQPRQLEVSQGLWDTLLMVRGSGLFFFPVSALPELRRLRLLPLCHAEVSKEGFISYKL